LLMTWQRGRRRKGRRERGRRSQKRRERRSRTSEISRTSRTSSVAIGEGVAQGTVRCVMGDQWDVTGRSSGSIYAPGQQPSYRGRKSAGGLRHRSHHLSTATASLGLAMSVCRPRSLRICSQVSALQTSVASWPRLARSAIGYKTPKHRALALDTLDTGHRALALARMNTPGL
jgi:hypothetical protein